jgi:hypothetical protein
MLFICLTYVVRFHRINVTYSNLPELIPIQTTATVASRMDVHMLLYMPAAACIIPTSYTIIVSSASSLQQSKMLYGEIRYWY